MSTDTSTASDTDTVIGHLDAAGESIRQATHSAHSAEAPTPAEVYDQIGALAALAGRLDQHLRRLADVLDTHAAAAALRDTEDADDPSLTARTCAFRLRGTATERLDWLGAELAAAHTAVSTLYLAEDDEES